MTPPQVETRITMSKTLDLYLIPARGSRYVLFSRHDDLVAIEAESTDHVRQFIDWLSHRPSRLVSWVGLGIRSLHDYYLKLEDKIDPGERVLKAMASTNRYIVYTHNREAFQLVLNRQRWKHVFWFSLDFVTKI